MARIRTIKPEFWTSGQLAECSRDARLLFIGLWNFCDDAGRLPFRPKEIKAKVFPTDDILSDTVTVWLRELSGNGLILVYSVDGTEFLQVTGWHHQYIAKRQTAKYPSPDDGVPVQLPELNGSGSVAKPHPNGNGPTPRPEQYRNGSVRKGMEKEGKGRERNHHSEPPYLDAARDVPEEDGSGVVVGWEQEGSATVPVRGKPVIHEHPPLEAKTDEWVKLCVDIVQAFEAANSPNLPDTSETEIWKASGFQPSVCLAVVKQGIAKKPDVASLRYFTTAIKRRHQEIAEGQAVSAPSAPKPKTIMTPEKWDAAVALYRSNESIWPRELGPEPIDPMCRAPTAVLRKYRYLEEPDVDESVAQLAAQARGA